MCWTVSSLMKMATTLPVPTSETHPAHNINHLLKKAVHFSLSLISFRNDEQDWRAGIGNLKVTSLHAHNSESTALVWWPENEIFQPHAHNGGE